MDVPWAVTPEKVEKVIQKIIEVSHPRQLILFGSYVRDNMNINSDLDVLVVTRDDIESPRKESARIQRALKGLLMAVDIVVVPEGLVSQLKDAPGLIYKEAFQHGKTVYES